MAKQTGIHQIRGKVGEMSYYQQAGVASGLIRSINQGMSSRVKTAEEYINTRLNNREFKNAIQIATFGYRMIPRKVVTSLRRFAIAEMTKAILPYIKSGEGDWGSRVPSVGMDVVLCDALENRAKQGVYSGEYGVFTVEYSNNSFTVHFEVDSNTLATLEAQGISAYSMKACFAIAADRHDVAIDGITIADLASGLSSEVPFTEVSTRTPASPQTINFTPSAANFHIPVSLYQNIQTHDNYGIFVVIAILPLRDIDQTYYPLVEGGTFVALPCGQIPD